MQLTYGKGFAVAPTREQLRAKILQLQEAMFADPSCDPQCKDFPVKHFRAPGMIGRQMLLPAGSVIIGKIHKHAHLNLIAYGHVVVLTEAGEVEMRGTQTFTSEPGTKRAVVTLEDTLWTTFHLNPNDYDPDNEDEMRLLEAEIIAPSYDALEHFNQLSLEAA